MSKHQRPPFPSPLFRPKWAYAAMTCLRSTMGTRRKAAKTFEEPSPSINSFFSAPKFALLLLLPPMIRAVLSKICQLFFTLPANYVRSCARRPPIPSESAIVAITQPYYGSTTYAMHWTWLLYGRALFCAAKVACPIELKRSDETNRAVTPADVLKEHEDKTTCFRREKKRPARMIT